MSPIVNRTLLAAAALAALGWLGLRVAPALHRPRVIASAQLPSPSNVEPPPPVDVALLPDPSPPARDLEDATQQRAWMLAEGPAPAANDGRRLVTLTFDDGPRPETTSAILDLLDAHRIQGTFFFVGKALMGSSESATAARAIAREAVSRGHLAGSHTVNHTALTDVSRAEAIAEIDGGIDAVAFATGTLPTLFRPPYGALDAFAEAHLRARAQRLVLWSVAVGAERATTNTDSLAEIEEQLDYAGGGIVLLHDMRRSTVRVVRRLLTWLDARKYDPANPSRVGFVVVDLVTYLRETAAHPQPYADRRALESARAVAAQDLRRVARKPAVRRTGG